jgi:hypothetical protein
MEEKFLKYESKLNNKLTRIAILLDPRLNQFFFEDANEKKEAIGDLKYIFNCNYVCLSNNFSGSSNDNNESEFTMQIYKKRKLNQEDELDLYFRTPEKNADCDPIDWWQKHKTIFPSLCKIAFDILCIACSSLFRN